jgi:hypothetical protein
MQHNLYYTKPKNCSRAYDLILICPKRFAWNSQRVTRKVSGQLTSHRVWKRQKSISKVLADIKVLFLMVMTFCPHLRSATSIARMKRVFAPSINKFENFLLSFRCIFDKMTWKMKILMQIMKYWILIMIMQHKSLNKTFSDWWNFKEKFFVEGAKLEKFHCSFSLNLFDAKLKEHFVIFKNSTEN